MNDKRSTLPVTISLPPQLVAQTDRLIKDSGKTRSEIFREALLDYFDKLELARLRRYGQRQAAKLSVRPTDIESLVAEARQEYRRTESL